MTVPVPDQLEYVSDADGVTKDFAYPKRFMQKDELVVFLRDDKGIESRQLLNTHYKIAGTSWPNGGTVSFVKAPEAPYKVVRYRMTEAKQTVGLANNQRNDAPSVETQLDRLTMGNQDTRKLADRSLKFAAGAGGHVVQPVPLPERGKALVGNPEGTGYINAPVGEGDIAVAVIEATEARDEAVDAKNTAVQSDASAGASASTATNAATAAVDAKNAAVAAATSLHNYDTLAQADANLANIPNDAGVNILADGDNNGFYVKESGLLVRKSKATVPSLDHRTEDLENLTVRIASGPGILGALVDEQYRPSWMQARDTDGLQTDYSRDVNVERIEEIRVLGLRMDIPGVLAAIADLNDTRTWAIWRETDGQHPEWVMEEMAPRLWPYMAPLILALISGGATRLSSKDRYVRGTEVLPVMADMSRISGWGSSSMERSASALSSMASDFGASYYSGGDGGTRSQHTAARFGSIPALLTVAGGQIPASGSVSVTASNMPPTSSMDSFTGSLAGVKGTLSSDATTLNFTRASAGDAVSVDPDAPFLPDIGPNYRNSLVLLWMGKNNLTGAGTDQLVIQQTDATFDWLSPHVRRALVLGHYSDQDTPEVSEKRDAINAVNAAHALRYGELFVDVSAYVTGPQVWIDMNVTPTSGDLAAQAIGNIPPSLSSDNSHLTTSTYAAIVRFLIRPRLISLGYFQETVQ